MKVALMMVLSVLWLSSGIACHHTPPLDPVRVEAARAEGAQSEGRGPLRAARPHTADPEAPAHRDDEAPSEPPSSGRSGSGTFEAGGIWVIDDAGQPVGLLVRRGSDDNLVYRAIYDVVTVFHPESGLFFEITMSDAVVRRPSTTFFAGATCETPIGISYGGCAECRSGPGIGIFHEGTWYQAVAGVTFEVTSAGSTLGSGLQDACSAHHTDSAKIFPLEALSGPTPPVTFSAPLHITYR